MATRVPLQNPATNQVRVIKVGFSWTSFFFSGFFGLPLFLRGLVTQGLLMIAYQVAYVATYVSAMSDTGEAQITGGLVLLYLLGWGLAFFFGFRANAMAGRKCLANGWKFATPESSEALIAAAAWGVAAPHHAPNRRATEVIESDARPANDSIDKLERLVAMKQKGLISDAEFAAEKAKMI